MLELNTSGRIWLLKSHVGPVFLSTAMGVHQPDPCRCSLAREQQLLPALKLQADSISNWTLILIRPSQQHKQTCLQSLRTSIERTHH